MKKVKKTKEERFCLLEDDDCHWYLLPLNLKIIFQDELKNALYDDEWERFNELFEQYICSGPHNISFTNPKEK